MFSPGKIHTTGWTPLQGPISPALLQADEGRALDPDLGSLVEALIVALPAHPILTVATGQKLLGRSKQAVNAAIAVLAGSGVLRPLTLARRNLAWEARERFDLVDDLERALAMPDEDGPSAPSPRRRD